MSTAKQKNKQLSITKQHKTPVWVWFLAVVPVISSVLFLVIAADLIPFIKLDIFYDKIDGGMGWHTSGILVLIITMAVWGACGFLYGYFRSKMQIAVITAHAFPIVCTVVYTVCIISKYFYATYSSAAEDVMAEVIASFEKTALYSAVGMGLFSYIDTFIYGIISLGYFGVYVDLIFMIFTFIVGYSIGKSRKLKA